MSIMAAVVAATIVASSGEGRVSSRDDELDVPTFYWATPEARRDYRAMRLTPAEAARRYLIAHAELYRAAPARLARAQVTGVHDLHDGTAVIVTFQQRVDEVRVFRDELKVIMTAKLELVAISGFLTPELRRLGTFALTPESAVTSAWLELVKAPLETAALERIGTFEGDYTQWRTPQARGVVRTRPTWFPSKAGLTPGYYVDLEHERGAFSFVISAVDGAVLYSHDLTRSHRYAAWADPVTLHPWPGPHGPSMVPHPSALPDGAAEPAKLQAPIINLVHAGLSTGDPWLTAGATETRGNNVEAYVDYDWPNGFTVNVDDIAETTAAGEFLWQPYDFANPQLWTAHALRAAGVVHAFYVTNYLHDWFYDDGFNELSRNGQVMNFARGGAGNDPLQVETMDWSGVDNANMSTPADGRSGRMQLYLFGSWRDGALDSGVIAHEWGHFISNRLIGDGDGLSSLQAGGLGEGWGDFHAALLLATAEDAQVATNSQWQGTYSLAPWAAMQITGNPLYYGLRRYPLSADLSKNPLNFRHISDGLPLPAGVPHASGGLGPNAEVHNTGEVWAVMLWDCYVQLLNDSRYTFEQARARMKRTLVAAYKATPLTPTFVEARDAVLAVAAASDLLDLNLFTNAFARRGLGLGAVAPARNAQHNSPLTESFSVGGNAQVGAIKLLDDVTPCDGDGTLDVGEQGRVTITIRNIGTATLTGATLTVSSDPELMFPAGATRPIPDLGSFDTVTIEAPVTLASSVRGARALNITAAVSGTSLTSDRRTVSFRVNSDVKPASGTSDDVEAPQTLWTAASDPIYGPTRTFAPEELTSTQRVWRAPSPLSTADLTLTSPPLHVGSRGLRLTFLHRFDFDRAGTEHFDGAVIELSTDDGASWTDVASALTPPYNGTISDPQSRGTNPLKGRAAFVGQSDNYPAFVGATLDLSAQANKTLRLRFRLAGDDGVSWPARGWELDNLVFDGLSDTPFASVVGDPNSCTNQAPVASAGAPREVDEGTRLVLDGTATDADGDAVTLTWTQTAGPAGALLGSAFITPEVNVDTPVTLTLVASDGRASSAPSHLELTVRDVNRPPTVSVAVALEVNRGERATLKAMASDPEGDPVTFEWRQVSGPPVQLEGASTAEVSFLAPEVTITEQVALQVVARDGHSESAPGRSVVTVRAPAVQPAVEEPAPMPKGCGCSSAEGLVVVIAALLARRGVRS